MDRLLTVALFVLLVHPAVHSQTQLWRVQGGLAVQDGLGNTYISKSHGISPDSLSKVSPAGDIVWKVPLPAIYYHLYYTSGGIYVTPKTTSYDGSSVLRYDSDGNLLWEHPLQGAGYLAEDPTIDDAGNIIVAYDASPGNPAPMLLKLSPAGETVFEISIPIVVPTFNTYIIRGAVAAENGNIWVVVQAANEIVPENPGSVLAWTTGYETVLLYDGTTGQLLKRTDIFKGIVDNQRDDGRGNTISFTSNAYNVGGPSVLLARSGNSLVTGGFFTSTSWKCRANKPCVVFQKSDWRLTHVSQTGKVSRFRYRGDGQYKEVSPSERSTTDDDANVLSEITSGAGSVVLLHGSVARGKMVNGVGTRSTDDMLMFYNGATRRVDWRFAQPFSTNYVFKTYLYQPTQRILRQRDSRTIDVYNLQGAVSGTPLVFPEDISLPAQSGKGYPIANSEDGALLVTGFSSDFQPRSFIAKYSIAEALARQQFDLRVAVPEASMPYRFSLTQNYPNPFNPTTTIEFELPADAVVTVRIFNSLGQEMAVLADREEFGAGTNQLDFDADGLPSGVYYYRLTAAGIDDGGLQYSSMKKMVLIK